MIIDTKDKEQKITRQKAQKWAKLKKQISMYENSEKLLKGKGGEKKIGNKLGDNHGQKLKFW